MSDKDDDEVSLRDEIEAAFNGTNAKTDSVDNDDVIDKLEKPRNEKGKFQAKAGDDKEGGEQTTEASEDEDKSTEKPSGKATETDTTVEGAENESTDEHAVTLNNEKAPTSWAPGIREKWGTLPADVRAEIIRREEASANGVRKLHEEYAPIRQFAEGLGPFIQEARQSGADPTQYIQNVMASERGLRNPDPKQRFSVLLNIAEQYGIPLRDIINQSAGEEVIPQIQRQQYAPVDPQIQQQLADMQNFRVEMQQDALRKEVEAFKVDKEFFDDVSDIMADLIDANRATDMADAYEQACWVHPEIRKVLIERERTGKKATDLKAKQTQASGATVKASGAADIKVDTDDDDSIEATIRKAMVEASGRV